MNQRLKQYKKIRIILSVLLVVILLIGTSFAIFQNFARQSGTNNLGATNCFSVTFEGVNNAINLANDYPIPDSEGLERDPYTFKVTNNCNQYLSLSIGVETLSTSEIPSNLIKGVIIKNGGIPTSAMLLSSGKTMEAQNGGTAYEILTDGLGANSSKTYDLRLWFDESMTKEQGASKKYQGKVIVGASAEVESPKNLREAILANNDVVTPLTVPGRYSSTETEALLASTEDDYGTSYYFRGNVKNNYVEFAGKCWRIVRILGNQSTKLVLSNDNVANSDNPCDVSNNNDNAAFAHYDGSTYKSEYNSGDGNAMIGLMYGATDECDGGSYSNQEYCMEVGYTWITSNSYTEAHTNSKKSIILKNLEKWYENNLLNYEEYLKDVIWCNDKSTFTTFTSGEKTYGNGLGYGTNQSDYGAYNRIYGGGVASYASPSLICPNDNNGGKLSKFTVDDIINGNGDLTYKVGLLTVDEIAYSGMSYNTETAKTFLNDNTGSDYWWTLSPRGFNLDRAVIYTVKNGAISYDRCWDGRLRGIRPAIALISSVEVTGSGTSEDPYVIK